MGRASPVLDESDSFSFFSERITASEPPLLFYIKRRFFIINTDLAISQSLF